MNAVTVSEDVCWYAVRTKPMQEERADDNLRAWKVETFTPRLKERRFARYAAGPTYAVKPLFPRYIFAKFNAQRLLHKVNYTRGVQNVVGFGEWPTPIDDEIIDLIKAQVDEDGFVKVGEEFKFGDKVKIKSGPFKSLVGVFERKIKDTDRVKILLTTVSYQSNLVIDRGMIEKVDPSYDMRLLAS